MPERFFGVDVQMPCEVHDGEQQVAKLFLTRSRRGLGVKLGKLAQPLRAALTGRTTSPGIFDVLALLGQGESLARIADQMVEPNE